MHETMHFLKKQEGGEPHKLFLLKKYIALVLVFLLWVPSDGTGDQEHISVEVSILILVHHTQLFSS